VAERVDRPVGAVPVEEAEIEIRAQHMGAQLLLDLVVEKLSGLAVDHAVDVVHGTAVKHRELKEVGVRHDPRDAPAPRGRHLDLALDQRLADLEIRIQLAALKYLALDRAARRGLDLANIVPEGHVPQMCGRGIDGKAQAVRLAGRASAAPEGGGDKRRARGNGKCATRRMLRHGMSSVVSFEEWRGWWTGGPHCEWARPASLLRTQSGRSAPRGGKLHRRCGQRGRGRSTFRRAPRVRTRGSSRWWPR